MNIIKTTVKAVALVVSISAVAALTSCCSAPEAPAPVYVAPAK